MGKFPNFDYDEFSVSQDEYGFVIVEVSKEENSKITIKRIGRGDQDTIVDNVLRDSFTIRIKPNLVEKPIAVGPLGEEFPECVTLKSSPFISKNVAIGHGQSHWQVTTLDQGFNEPVFESWKNFENWYGEIDTQEGDDLTDEEVIGLEPFTTYYWRVRYRDKELNWSEWSEPERFTTKESIALPNLLVNPGAENDLNGWVIQEGVVEALTAGTCNGTSPHSGQKYFAVGGLCDHSPVGIATQDIDVTNMADSIDSGIFQANFGGYLSDYSGSDVPEIKLIYLNAMGDSLSQSPTLSTLNNSWTMLGETVIIPTGTRTIRFEMKGTRRAGTDNDSYFDDVFLKIGRPLDCTSLVSVRQNYQAYIPNLKISPNPFKERTIIQLPETCTECLVQMVDMNGTKVNASYHISEDMLHLKRENLTAGNYFIWVKKGNRIIGKGKIQVLD
ncbi:MAG: T9SS type A sorting domain-containing protein [Saprospiraceae bacterium]